MITFKYATMLPYAVHLNYEQIDKIFTFYSEWADEVTNGDRSVWCLHLTGNTLTIAFKRKRDLDQFAKVFQEHATTGSGPAGSRDCGGKRRAPTGKWHRRNFTSSYVLTLGSLDPEHVGQLGGQVSELADMVTENDRAAYEVWFQDDDITIGFEHEEDCNKLAQIFDAEAALEEDGTFDLTPQAAASLHQITVH
ncbi:hypothetical protein ACRBEV_12290 [Methylobacterium phyllosphaerae]